MTPDELADDQKRVTTWQEWNNPENIARRERQMKEAIANHRPRGPRDGK
jgi:hypothetical protein